jgi:hypothetical protein
MCTFNMQTTCAVEIFGARNLPSWYPVEAWSIITSLWLVVYSLFSFVCLMVLYNIIKGKWPFYYIWFCVLNLIFTMTYPLIMNYALKVDAGETVLFILGEISILIQILTAGGLMWVLFSRSWVLGGMLVPYMIWLIIPLFMQSTLLWTRFI